MTEKASNARKQSDFSLAVVAQIRAEMGVERMSTRTLARLSGVPERTLARLIAGERTIDVAQLDMLCRALGIPLATMLERASERLTGPGESSRVAGE